MAEHVHTTSRGQPLPFPLIDLRGHSNADARPELIDFGNHPDAELLQLCATLVKLQDAHGRLEDAIGWTERTIRRTAPLTADGRRMKRLAI